MQALVKHLLKTNIQEIIAKSLLDCHVKGLHSIMLLDAPGKRIRMYIALPGHTLDRNMPDAGGNFTQPLSLAFHPHHCSLTLHCIKGKLTNIEMTENGVPGDVYSPYLKYRYRSKIKDGEMHFTPLGETSLTPRSIMTLNPTATLFMEANSIHTVSCSAQEVTAWLVYEGAEDPEYIPYAYSNHDLNT